LQERFSSDRARSAAILARTRQGPSLHVPIKLLSTITLVLAPLFL